VAIKAVAMDVDGVLTDGTVWLDEAGHELKRVSFADIMGVSIGRHVGLVYALVSGESGPSLDRIAAKFGIADVYSGCKDKAAAVRDFAARHGLELSEVCFIGDDVNDVPALEICGLAVVPADAQPAALANAVVVTARSGGAGCVREVVDALLAGSLQGAVQSDGPVGRMSTVLPLNASDRPASLA
jgi:3-deoxy-D-manno-octulosonate 8-phosphate phosphatase (KDO 8-P phosphatase)